MEIIILTNGQYIRGTLDTEKVNLLEIHNHDTITLTDAVVYEGATVLIRTPEVTVYPSRMAGWCRFNEGELGRGVY